jgi:N-acetylmuramoyl-L-alanine amidase
MYYKINYMILRLNSKNHLVKDLQIRLNSLGFTISNSGPGSPGNETDFFGRLTESAVIRFQKNNNLKSDGVVGSKTWESILKNEQNKINPIFTVSAKEDFSDPEEEIIVDNIKENLPTCPNIIELINLINKSNITRNITRLIFHCTATQQNATITAIQRYWREKLKWKNPGYHIIVTPNGSWTQLANFNNITNGVAGINSTSLHISYIGGVGSNGRALDNRTEKQKEIFETIYNLFKNKLPHITFHGHYEFSNKACPSFNVKEEIKIWEKNN